MPTICRRSLVQRLYLLILKTNHSLQPQLLCIRKLEIELQTCRAIKLLVIDFHFHVNNASSSAATNHLKRVRVVTALTLTLTRFLFKFNEFVVSSIPSQVGSQMNCRVSVIFWFNIEDQYKFTELYINKTSLRSTGHCLLTSLSHNTALVVLQ